MMPLSLSKTIIHAYLSTCCLLTSFFCHFSTGINTSSRQYENFDTDKKELEVSFIKIQNNPLRKSTSLPLIGQSSHTMFSILNS